MTRKGEMPGEGELERREPRSIELRGRFEGARMCIVEQAMRIVSEAEGRALSFEEYLVAVSLGRISGSLNPDERSVEKIYEDAERDLAAQEAPWAAVAAVEEPAPSDPEVQLAKPARVPHWANTRLDFNAESRHTTTGQRAEIQRRDGYRCSTTGLPAQSLAASPSRRFLLQRRRDRPREFGFMLQSLPPQHPRRISSGLRCRPPRTGMEHEGGAPRRDKSRAGFWLAGPRETRGRRMSQII